MKFELLSKHHNKKAFDCGNDEINQYLWQFASQHHKKGVAKVHILANDLDIVGFYTLSSLSIEPNIKGYPKTVPAIIIGRMGIDKKYQGQGLSNTLLWHALKHIKQVSKTVGVIFVVIDAKNESLATYYQKFGFIPTHNPLRLILNVDGIDE